MYTELNIKLWPGMRGYYWSVPVGESSCRMSMSGDIGTAVRDALDVARTEYGARLGAVNFQLTSGF